MGYGTYDNYEPSMKGEKYPVWTRLIIIAGLSALLWDGIINGMIALFG